MLEKEKFVEKDTSLNTKDAETPKQELGYANFKFC